MRELLAPQNLVYNVSGSSGFTVARLTLFAVEADIFFDTLYVGLRMCKWARCSIELTGGENRRTARPDTKRQRR